MPRTGMGIRWGVAVAAGLLIILVLAKLFAPLASESAWPFQVEPAPTQCAEIGNQKPQGVTFTDPEKAKDHPRLFCSCLSDAARRTSSSWSSAAIMLGLCGGFLTLLGGALGPLPNSVPGTWRSQRGILLAGTGALLIAFAVYANSRATAASSVAAEAHSALALPDDKVFEACIRAKSVWMSSRIESAGLFLHGLGTEASRTPRDPSTPNRTD